MKGFEKGSKQMQLWIGVWGRGWARGSMLGLAAQQIEGTVRGTAGRVPSRPSSFLLFLWRSSPSPFPSS